MCTEEESKKIMELLLKYDKETPVDDEDREMLDRLVRAAYVDYVLKDDDIVYARVNGTARGLKNLIV
jgi:hypothetical protein